MKAGTIQRTRDAALRQSDLAVQTRALRQRSLSTENGHAALRLVPLRLPGVTRAFQSDSSSKRPAFTADSDFPGGSLTATRFDVKRNGHGRAWRGLTTVAPYQAAKTAPF
jgi:hypothetical protein